MGRLGCLTLAAVLGVALIVWSGVRQALVPFGDLLQVETEELDSAQAAALLGFPSPAALNRWADRHPAHALPRQRRGRTWTFRRSELVRWQEARIHAAAAAGLVRGRI